MRRTMTRSEEQVMQAKACYRARQRARQMVVSAARKLSRFEERESFPSGRQRQKYVREARHVARQWWLALQMWHSASAECSVTQPGIDVGYLLRHSDLYTKRQRLLSLRQNCDDEGVER